jgi:hypothetical protein
LRGFAYDFLIGSNNESIKLDYLIGIIIGIKTGINTGIKMV